LRNEIATRPARGTTRARDMISLILILNLILILILMLSAECSQLYGRCRHNAVNCMRTLSPAEAPRARGSRAGRPRILHLIKNSGSSGETRRNSSSFPYIYESSSMHELAILCSSAHYIVCKLVSVCGAPNHSVNSTAFSREV